MTRRGHIWVLNPGAERELIARRAPEQRTLAQMKARSSLFDALCQSEPRVWLDDLSQRGDAERVRALLWCPTPRALALSAASGLVPQAAPPLAVLSRVLSKSFLGEALPGWTAPHHRVVRTMDEYAAVRGATRDHLRAKRLDGYAGKGQRTLPFLEKPGDLLWLQHNLAQGLIVEAELTAIREFSVHGIVTEAEIIVGAPCEVHVDHARAPLRSPTACPQTPWSSQIRRAGQEVAEALGAVGYFGPFGLDLIATETSLCATDLNARFTLGFSTGLGPARDRAISLILGPGR